MSTVGAATRILLIEDEPGDVRLITVSLDAVESPAYVIEHAVRLSDGLELLERSHFDVVLLDLGLPDSQGVDTFRRINDRHREIPVVVLSGTDDTEVALRAVRAGAQDYVPKIEITTSVLHRALGYAVERARMASDLRRLNDALTRLLLSAAHELRGPVASIDLLVRSLADRVSDANLEDLQAVGRHGDRVKAVIEGLLDVARYVDQRSASRIGTVNVADAVTTTIRFHPAPTDVDLSIDIDADVVAVADPVRIVDVLGSILSNAYRFGGPNVAIEARHDGDAVVIAVTDDGPGVADALVATVFDPFIGEGGGAGSTLGLGLHIARVLVRGFGGDIAYSTMDPNGARFEVRLRPAPSSAG